MNLAIRGQRVGLPRMAATLLVSGLTEWERNQTLRRLLKLKPPLSASVVRRGSTWELYVGSRDLERAKLAMVPDRVALRRDHYVPGTDVMLLSRPTKMPGPGWSLPAGRGTDDQPGACPFMFLEGPDPICGGPCYAMTGRYVDPVHKAAMQARFKWTRESLKTPEGTESFIAAMVSAIADSGYTYFRVHDSGDLFSPAYTRAWTRIAAALPEIHFWIPTRSWRAPWMEQIVTLAELPNVAVRPSALNFEDPPPMITGLAAGTSATRTDGYTCPAPRQGHRCADCRVCWDNPEQPVIYKETGFAVHRTVNGVPTMPTNGHVASSFLEVELQRRPVIAEPPPPPRQLAPPIDMEGWVAQTRHMISKLDREKDELRELIEQSQARVAEIDELQAPMRQIIATIDAGLIRVLDTFDPAQQRARTPVAMAPPIFAPPKTIDGKPWSRNYAVCQGCHKTDTPHSGGGFCRRCYGAGRSRMARANARAAFR